MSDNIKVGDRVKYERSDSGWRYEVLCIHGDQAWLRDERDGMYQGALIENLTRIEPEKVTLTPLYEVGERVHWLTTSRMKTIRAIVVGYRMEEDPNGAVWGEDELEPVPDVCPQCKGTGK